MPKVARQRDIFLTISFTERLQFNWLESTDDLIYHLNDHNIT
jgi:hypothetical protein